jgi:hypothetical protein
LLCKTNYCLFLFSKNTDNCVEKLTVTNCFDCYNDKDLLDLIKKIPCVVGSFRLRGFTGLTNSNIEFISKLNPSLTSLSLSCCGQSYDANYLSDLVVCCSLLRSIHLFDCNINLLCTNDFTLRANSILEINITVFYHNEQKQKKSKYWKSSGLKYLYRDEFEYAQCYGGYFHNSLTHHEDDYHEEGDGMMKCRPDCRGGRFYA